jgi:hypothetical protein
LTQVPICPRLLRKARIARIAQTDAPRHPGQFSDSQTYVRTIHHLALKPCCTILVVSSLVMQSAVHRVTLLHLELHSRSGLAMPLISTQSFRTLSMGQDSYPVSKRPFPSRSQSRRGRLGTHKKVSPLRTYEAPAVSLTAITASSGIPTGAKYLNRLLVSEGPMTSEQVPLSSGNFASATSRESILLIVDRK